MNQSQILIAEMSAADSGLLLPIPLSRKLLMLACLSKSCAAGTVS
jgi:hypothetical protein